MGLRRFLNIVTLNRKSGIYSLRRMDLSRLDLFFSETPRKAEHKNKKLNVHEMESVRLPAASLRFHPNPSPDAIHHKWKVDCFGLSENRIICADNCGLAFLCDAGARAVVPLPSLHYPKRCPISLSIPNAASSDDDDWTLPFHGKAEYVPELDVWFGISDTDFLPCASSDLSRVLEGEKPELCAVWRNRWFPPPEWESFMATQIVNLGDGRLAGSACLTSSILRVWRSTMGATE
ncbi:unnamed protein product [Urochloa humidicola]